MRVRRAVIYNVGIPFRIQVTHSLAQRSTSESIVARLISDDGMEGFGEGAPREYVTGERPADSLRALVEIYRDQIAGLELGSPAEVAAFLEDLRRKRISERYPAAFCAIETALLDLAGRLHRRGLTDMLGLGDDVKACYSVVIPIMPEEMLKLFLKRCVEHEMGSVKMKVRGRDTVRSVGLARETLGENVDIRVDVNGAWTASEAEESLKILADYGVSSVEQPLPKNDTGGLAQLALKSEIPIVLDESVCTLRDLRRMNRSYFPFILNVRLSKCGGILNLLEMYHEAQKNGIPCQLGCQVGETGLLSALGRRLAGALPFLHIEGCFGNHLLEQDIVAEDLTFGVKGWVEPIEKDGLGVTVRRHLLEKYSDDPIVVEDN